MIIVANQNLCNAVAIYLRRWEIECLFACLEGRGFRFEETHLIDRARIKKMMPLLVIGLCWAHQIGGWRPQNGYLRYGLNYH